LKLANRCSIVAMERPIRAMVVQESVADRLSMEARIATCSAAGSSVRRKTMPVSAAAGFSAIETCLPLCTPIPVTTTRFFSVVCGVPARLAIDENLLEPPGYAAFLSRFPIHRRRRDGGFRMVRKCVALQSSNSYEEDTARPSRQQITVSNRMLRGARSRGMRRRAS